MATRKSDNTEPRDEAPAGHDEDAEPGEVTGDDATKGEGVGEAVGPDVDGTFSIPVYDEPTAPA